MKTKVIIALGLITLLLSSCSKEVNGNDEHHATAALKYLTSNIWVSTEPHISRFILFNDDYSHKYYLQIEDYVDQIEGRYTFDESNNILKIYTETEYCINDFKVYKLTSSELWLGQFDPVTEEYLPVSIKYRRATNEDNIPDFFTNNKNEDNNNDNEQSLLNISSPVIQDITYSTAVVKGSVLGENIKFQDRGLCYSTSRAPTVEDTKVSHNNNIINKTITDLFVGTTYYVRLYAKIDDKYYYGEETSFTTDGNRASKIIFKDIEETSDLTNSRIKISALLPNEIENYGVCYGKSPHPKITDNYVEEAYRQTEWTLPKLECGYEYYVRAYHIEGTNIIYYENSETKITPVTKEQIQYKLDTINKRGDYASYSLLVTLNGLPDGVYEVDIEIYRLMFSDEPAAPYNRVIDNQKKYVEIINNKASTDFSGELYSSYNSEFYISYININAVDSDDVRRISIKRSL